MVQWLRVPTALEVVLGLALSTPSGQLITTYNYSPDVVISSSGFKGLFHACGAQTHTHTYAHTCAHTHTYPTNSKPLLPKSEDKNNYFIISINYILLFLDFLKNRLRNWLCHGLWVYLPSSSSVYLISGKFCSYYQRRQETHSWNALCETWTF